MKLQDKCKMLGDKRIADTLLRRMHEDTSNMLGELFKLHAAAEHISLVEQVMGDVHIAIHNAMDKLTFGREV